MKRPTGKAKEQIEIMKSLFYIGNAPNYFNDLDKFIKLKNEYNSLLLVFRQNITSIVDSISIPYNLAATNASSWLRNKIGVREAILGDKLSRKEIDDIVDKKYQDALNDQDEANELFLNMCSQLLEFTKNDDNLALELIIQGYLQAWSSFEVFVRDYIELYINKHPEKCINIINSDVLKKRVDLKKISYEFLSVNDFNISDKLGSLVVDTYDCSDLLVAKEIIKKVNENEETSDVLDSNELWQFFQTRHLLIHKRGIVDQAYIDKTGLDTAVGERISIRPTKLKYTLDIIIKTVCKIVE